jgi:hypothetical protein
MRSSRDKSTARPRFGAAVALGLLAGLLAACGNTDDVLDLEGIGFRESRFEDASAMHGFRACRDEALRLDSLARASGETARYRASAELFEQCEAGLGPDAAGIPREERMRAYGLSIQNYIKAGDQESARENLDRFRQAFPKNDLYYPDGSSFLHSMEALLRKKDPKEFGIFTAYNVNGTLKDEMRRIAYWKHN